MPLQHVYLTPAETLDQLPAGKDWKRAGVSILASLPQPFSQSLFVQEFSAVSLAAVVNSIRAAVPQADLGISILASCERAVQLHRPELATFNGYDLSGPFLPNVERLAAAAKSAGLTSFGVDAEIYISTPGNSGGKMIPGTAWPASPQVAAHGQAFRKALAGLPLLCYVWLDDLLRVTRGGVPLFPGWRAWVRSVQPKAILDESYVAAHGHRGAVWEHTPVIPGIYLTKQVARRLPRESRFLWTQQGPGSVWGR